MVPTLPTSAVKATALSTAKSRPAKARLFAQLFENETVPRELVEQVFRRALAEVTLHGFDVPAKELQFVSSGHAEQWTLAASFLARDPIFGASFDVRAKFDVCMEVSSHCRASLSFSLRLLDAAERYATSVLVGLSRIWEHPRDEAQRQSLLRRVVADMPFQAEHQDPVSQAIRELADWLSH